MELMTPKRCKHYKRPRKPRIIEYIVIHYPGSVANGEQQCHYYTRCNRVVSAHYVVDDEKVYSCLPDRLIAFHVVSSGNVRNDNAIGIDLVAHKENLNHISAYDLDWYHTPQTLTTAAKLVATLLQTYQLPISHVVRHYDVTGKRCPATMVGRYTQIHWLQSGDTLWNNFLSMIELELGTD